MIFPNWFTMWGVDHQHPLDLPLAYKKCENKTSQASQKPAKKQNQFTMFLHDYNRFGRVV